MSVSAANEVLFNPQTRVAPLGVIAMNGATDLGEKIDHYLAEWSKEGGYDTESFLIEKLFKFFYDYLKNDIKVIKIDCWHGCAKFECSLSRSNPILFETINTL